MASLPGLCLSILKKKKKGLCFSFYFFIIIYAYHFITQLGLTFIFYNIFFLESFSATFLKSLDRRLPNRDPETIDPLAHLLLPCDAIMVRIYNYTTIKYSIMVHANTLYIVDLSNLTYFHIHLMQSL